MATAVVPREHLPLLAELQARMVAALAAAGFDDAPARVPAAFQHGQVRRDPYDGSEALYLEWLDGNGARLGHVLVHADGLAFAELDVVQPHPRRPRRFVEAVTAWGRAGAVVAELRLLDMPD